VSQDVEGCMNDARSAAAEPLTADGGNDIWRSAGTVEHEVERNGTIENSVNIPDSMECEGLVTEPEPGRGGSGCSGSMVGPDGLVEILIFGCDNLNDAVDERYEKGGHTGPCCENAGGKFRRLAGTSLGGSGTTFGLTRELMLRGGRDGESRGDRAVRSPELSGLAVTRGVGIVKFKYRAKNSSSHVKKACLSSSERLAQSIFSTSVISFGFPWL
jgi:hypothetical protein